MPNFKPEQFPSLKRSVQAKWAPIYLSPVLGSPERFVIGVVAMNDSGFYVERANALRRFECLYGTAAETVVFAAELALDEMETDCANRGMEALNDPLPGFSGVSVGELADGESHSLADVAQTWLASISSVYDADSARLNKSPTVHTLVDIDAVGTVERLPSLVLDYVKTRRVGLEKFFSEDIRTGRKSRRRSNYHAVVIDFSGSHLVANFGTLRPRAASADAIKIRMWNLIANREMEKGTIGTRVHEMIVQHPTAVDPQISEHQFNAIQEAIEGLTEQAKNEGVKFNPMSNVDQIGKHILDVEAA